MRNLAKTLIMMVTVVMVLAFGVSAVEAAQKAYPAKKNAKLYEAYLQGAWGSNNKIKNGELNVINSDSFYLDVPESNYIMYYEKANGTNVNKVRTPNRNSKKVKGSEDKKFIITKDTTFKFKVIKGKVTAAKLKKAKTYYVVVKVKNVNPFKQTKETVSLDKGEKITVNVESLNKNTFDTLTYTTGGSNPTLKSKKLNTSLSRYNGIKINKNCTIKVNAYKLNKKVGTKTYNVTLKTYTKPSKYKFYTVESNWVLEDCQKIAYFDNGSGAYLTQSGIVVPDGFKLVTKYNGKNYYNYKLNTTNTFYYELYRARYYKVNGKYEFASWELMEKNTLTYKVWKNNFSMGYMGLSGYKAPVKSYTTAGYEGVWVYCKKQDDNTVYRTFLKPGEALDPDYYWIDAELKINGEEEWTSAQEDYLYYGDDLDGFCTYKAFKEACQGKHDFVNSPAAVTPTVTPTLAPVSPEVPQ